MANMQMHSWVDMLGKRALYAPNILPRSIFQNFRYHLCQRKVLFREACHCGDSHIIQIALEFLKTGSVIPRSEVYSCSLRIEVNTPQLNSEIYYIVTIAAAAHSVFAIYEAIPLLFSALLKLLKSVQKKSVRKSAEQSSYFFQCTWAVTIDNFNLHLLPVAETQKNLFKSKMNNLSKIFCSSVELAAPSFYFRGHWHFRGH